MINDENNVLTDNKLVTAREFSKLPKHAFLYVRNESPRESNQFNP